MSRCFRCMWAWNPHSLPITHAGKINSTVMKTCIKSYRKEFFLLETPTTEKANAQKDEESLDLIILDESDQG